jgi:putative ABC transport system substrate-binding protein
LTERKKITALAAGHGIPMMYNARDFVLAGGLVSYGPNVPNLCRQVGIYAARIIKGEKAGDLPVVQPTRFDLSINMKAAKDLGLTVSNQMQLLADEVIE